MRQALTPRVQRLRRHPPLVHGDGSAYAGLQWTALAWLDRHVNPSLTTLETGCGASTVVFAAGGAAHVTITPIRSEWAYLQNYCADEGIGLDRVEFIGEPSHIALSESWQATPLDLVLIDGAHGFPFPILDWFYTGPQLRVGGILMLDDAYLPTVNLLVRYLRSSSSWEVEAVPGPRTVCFRKTHDDPPSFDWVGSAFERKPRFDYLPPHRRLLAWSRHRVLERSLLAPLVQRAVVRRGRRGRAS